MERSVESVGACESKKEKKKQSKLSLLIKAVIVLLILLLVTTVICIILTASFGKTDTVATKFELSNGYSINKDIFITDSGTVSFYVYPESIEAKDIEVINSDESVALCLIKDVRNIAGKRLVIVSYKGISVGECSIYIKEKGGQAQSDKVNITVKEKQIEVDDSPTVYLNHTGDKYHYSAQCAGKTAVKSTLNNANKLYKEPCSKCAY